MRYNKLLKGAALALLCASVTGIQSANAQGYALSFQRPLGPVKTKMVNLENRLFCDFNIGLIDPLEYATLTRDLDGIRVHEEQLRQDSGLHLTTERHLMNRLAFFDSVINAHEADKVSSVATRQVILKEKLY